jgi:hypothetical protein
MRNRRLSELSARVTLRSGSSARLLEAADPPLQRSDSPRRGSHQLRNWDKLTPIVGEEAPDASSMLD